MTLPTSSSKSRPLSFHARQPRGSTATRCLASDDTSLRKTNALSGSVSRDSGLKTTVDGNHNPIRLVRMVEQIEKTVRCPQFRWVMQSHQPRFSSHSPSVQHGWGLVHCRSKACLARHLIQHPHEADGVFAGILTAGAGDLKGVLVTTTREKCIQNPCNLRQTA